MKPKFIRTSTRSFFQEANNIPGFSLFERLHGYIYGRWIYLYIELGVGEHRLVKKLAPVTTALKRYWPQKEVTIGSTGTLADGYHGKVLPTATAKELLTIQQNIHINDLEQVLPFPKARAIILQNPDHIIALDCPCRSARENPCTPLDVCLVVGEPFASFVHEHHPKSSRWINQQEAVAIIEAEQQRGHVSHAFFKDAMLGRFYAICNCCECCCGAMNAHRNGTPMLASSGYICEVADDLCIGCGTCEDVCQFGAVSISDGYSIINYEQCMGCGVCVEHCSQEALSLVRDENKGIPLEISKLLEQASKST